MKSIKQAIHLIYYDGLVVIVTTIMRFYLRSWQIANYDKIPHKGPVIFAANHQNAFLDPLIILFSQTRRIYFLVRANIFQNPTARFWLESLHMMPIYRVRDGLRSVAKNDEVIEKCVNLLTVGKEPLLLYAEGNHNLRRALRPLQKGIARIAFATMEANKFEIDLAIVPVGVNYGRHTRFRTDAFIYYGKPIKVKLFEDLYKENPNKAITELVNLIFAELDKVVLSIRPSAKYEYIENEWLAKRSNFNNKLEQFNNDKALIEQISANSDDEVSQEPSKEPTPQLPSLLYQVLMFPVFLYGIVNSFLGFKVMNLIIKKIVSDIHFYGSIKLAANLIVAPLVFGLQTLAVYLLTGSGIISLLYLVSLPFATVLAFDYKFAVFERLPRMKGVAEYKL